MRKSFHICFNRSREMLLTSIDPLLPMLAWVSNLSEIFSREERHDDLEKKTYKTSFSVPFSGRVTLQELRFEILLTEWPRTDERPSYHVRLRSEALSSRTTLNSERVDLWSPSLVWPILRGSSCNLEKVLKKSALTPASCLLVLA